MPDMENQYKEFKDKGVHILAINLKDTRLKAKTFRNQYGLTFPIASDLDESVRQAYNVLPLPTTILINKDGIIEDIITGECLRMRSAHLWKAFNPIKESII